VSDDTCTDEELGSLLGGLNEVEQGAYETVLRHLRFMVSDTATTDDEYRAACGLLMPVALATIRTALYRAAELQARLDALLAACPPWRYEEDFGNCWWCGACGRHADGRKSDEYRAAAEAAKGEAGTP
jgi:hypothetical protein